MRRALPQGAPRVSGAECRAGFRAARDAAGGEPAPIAADMAAIGLVPDLQRSRKRAEDLVRDIRGWLNHPPCLDATPLLKIAWAVVLGRIPQALVQEIAARGIEHERNGTLKCKYPRVYFVRTFKLTIFPRLGLDWSAPWGV